MTDFVIFGQIDVEVVQSDLRTRLYDAKPSTLNDFGDKHSKPNILWFKEGKPDHVAGLEGGTTEGTLGRCSSTVANRARCSDGGGVSINFIKLAAVLYCT